MSNSIYHRTEIAESLAKRLLTPTALQESARDGLFITGVRRIGKTTFLQQDLIPALKKKGAFVIYADLWGNREHMSPTQTVLSELQTAFSNLSSPFSVSELKVDLKLLSLSFRADQVGETNGVSLAHAFREVIDKVQTDIVLIIDEIQETLKSESGQNLLAALKSARDAVNLRFPNPDNTHLLIIGTGSHRSFVAGMASKSSQAFYGADRMDFPLLEEDYVKWEAERIRMSEAEDSAILPSEDALLNGFQALGFRPKTFRKLLQDLQSFQGVNEVDEAFLLMCTSQARSDAEEFLSPIKTSDDITKFIFTEIAKSGELGCMNLYSTAFLKRLTESVGRTSLIRASSVQAKLNKMQKLDWIYPVRYGSYAVSDPQAALVWLDHLEEYLNGF